MVNRLKIKYLIKNANLKRMELIKLDVILSEHKNMNYETWSFIHWQMDRLKKQIKEDDEECLNELYGDERNDW